MESSRRPSRDELEAELASLKEDFSKATRETSHASEDAAAMTAIDSETQKKLLVEEARKNAEEKVSLLEKKLAETEGSFSARIESLQAEQARAKASEEEERLHERERVHELEQKNEKLRSEKAVIDSQVDQLKLQLAEQDSEIRDLCDSVKLHQTNEISGRAAKLAAEGLRKEVDELRKRWQDAVRRADALSVDVQSSTAPLLRQLESTNKQNRARAAAWAELETQLRSELEENVINNEKLSKERTDWKTNYVSIRCDQF